MDEIGNKYGKLTILKKVRKDSHNTWVYLCQCDCGNLKEVNINKLHSGHTKSCGCLNHKLKDVTGQRFGRLVVVGLIGRKHNRTYWKCQCDCGNICEAPINMLLSNQKVSCGCKNKENRLSVSSLDRGCVDGTLISAIDGSRNINKNNTSGVTGVSFDSKRKKWIAQITFQRKNHLIGRFDNKDDAVRARLEAEEQYFGKYRK